MAHRNNSIIFIDQYSYLGGGQTVLIGMIESCLDAAWSTTVLAPTGGPLEQILREKFQGRVNHINLSETRMNVGRKTIFDVVKLAWATILFAKHVRLIRKHRLVHVNGPHFFLPNYFLSFLHRRKSFYHLHLNHSKIEKYLLKKINKAKTTAALLANSKFVKNELEKYFVYPSAKIQLLRFGLTKTMSTTAFDFERNPRVAVVIGRISKEKGQDLIIEAAKALPEVRFHIVGDSDFQDSEFKNSIKKIAPINCEFEGRATDVASKIRELKAGISVVPSRWNEPFGLVAVESMALSLYTVTSGRGGLAEIASETQTQTFETMQDLIQQLNSLTKEPSVDFNQKRLKQHEAAIKVFGWDQFSIRFLALLEEARGSIFQ